MSDRDDELQGLVARVAGLDPVADAWLAKSFTDRLFVVELDPGTSFPDGLRRTLADHDLYGCNAVYDLEDDDDSFVGTLAGNDRHHFVDVRTRGEHQSYVIQ